LAVAVELADAIVERGEDEPPARFAMDQAAPLQPVVECERGTGHRRAGPSVERSTSASVRMPTLTSRSRSEK
jgi:hypothetical protein